MLSCLRWKQLFMYPFQFMVDAQTTCFAPKMAEFAELAHKTWDFSMKTRAFEAENQEKKEEVEPHMG
jgi:hypothetical protein